jgi:2-polyprenyl-3-methyl-5-hydroxy-6-metoxy-1,4-benzoquinol methylase
MNRKQRRVTAKLERQGASAVARNAGVGPTVAELLAQAQGHHHAGRLADAESAYRKILANDPNHFDALHLLGVLAQQGGRSDVAVRLIGNAIALQDQRPRPHNIDRSRSAAARNSLAAAHSNLGIALMATGDMPEALKEIQRSLRTEETENGKLLFVQCLRSLTSIPDGIDCRDDLVRALSEPWGRPSDLSLFAANLIKSDGTTGACISRIASTWPTRPAPRELFGSSRLAKVCDDRLLRCLLETTIIFDLEMERFLTVLRQAMLEMASAEASPLQFNQQMLGFFCALAQQCCINEYIFSYTDKEKQQADSLRAAVIEALASGASIPEPQLVAVATFFPLSCLPQSGLLADRPWSAPLARFVTRHLREADEELRLRSSVPRLTAINDTVSLAVQAQYEDNPYPRWSKPSPVGRSTTIDAYLRQKFPLTDLRNVANANDATILIAGCGTGQHSIETARQFASARVLAIDLSLASLCYAKRKTQELGLKNIEYAQADILELQSIGDTFDVIEASGVLHHLAEPLVGWRVLLSLLRPGGFMRLGLYSRSARQDLEAARAFIAQRSYGASAHDIRRCRDALTGFGADTALSKVSEWIDFFSTSTCRDLLFHVQEHQFALPEIDEFLRQNRIEFLGFDLKDSALQNYRLCFPQDRAMTDLRLWHTFELQYPTLFTGMYQFWVRKPQ